MPVFIHNNLSIDPCQPSVEVLSHLHPHSPLPPSLLYQYWMTSVEGGGTLCTLLLPCPRHQPRVRNNMERLHNSGKHNGKLGVVCVEFTGSERNVRHVEDILYIQYETNLWQIYGHVKLISSWLLNNYGQGHASCRLHQFNVDWGLGDPQIYVHVYTYIHTH